MAHRASLAARLNTWFTPPTNSLLPTENSHVGIPAPTATQTPGRAASRSADAAMVSICAASITEDYLRDVYLPDRSIYTFAAIILAPMAVEATRTHLGNVRTRRHAEGRNLPLPLRVVDLALPVIAPLAAGMMNSRRVSSDDSHHAAIIGVMTSLGYAMIRHQLEK